MQLQLKIRRIYNSNVRRSSGDTILTFPASIIRSLTDVKICMGLLRRSLHTHPAKSGSCVLHLSSIHAFEVQPRFSLVTSYAISRRGKRGATYHEILAYRETANAITEAIIPHDMHICCLHGIVVDNENDLPQHYPPDERGTGQDSDSHKRLVGILLPILRIRVH